MNDLPNGVCRKGNSTYRRFKVKREGRWIDFYVKLPAPDAPDFMEELVRVEGDALDGKFGETGIRKCHVLTAQN